MAPPIVPRATYRLQFHKGFGFEDARRIVPYLAALGISHLYASPLTMARPGSTHGYDVVDFNRLNPELGEEAEFDTLIAELHAHDIGLLLDFVPNHMGVGSDNPWWLDVLEWGLHSPYATFFDIDWEASARGVRGKVTISKGQHRLQRTRPARLEQPLDLRQVPRGHHGLRDGDDLVLKARTDALTGKPKDTDVLRLACTR